MSIEKELAKAWAKASNLGGELVLLEPNTIDPDTASRTLISLLQATYTDHAISKNPEQLKLDIENHKVQPWFVTRDGQPVACAALIKQNDGSLELGRAVSVENGSGVGKIAMLSAALSKAESPLVAEVRLAGNFAGVPGSEATQRICLDLLNLVPHALLFAFSHGQPLRRELFAFSAENTKLLNNSPLSTAQSFLQGRDTLGPTRRLKTVQNEPFRVLVVDDSGIDHQEMARHIRSEGSGFTLVQIEATDHNLSTIQSLLNNEFVLVGLNRDHSSSGLPIIWLATIAKGETLAPAAPSSVLTKNLRDDIKFIDSKFRQLAGRS